MKMFVCLLLLSAARIEASQLAQKPRQQPQQQLRADSSRPAIEEQSVVRRLAVELLETGDDATAPIPTDLSAGSIHGPEKATLADSKEKKPTPTLERFMPQCLQHVKKMTYKIDHSYTDAQIVPTLHSVCLLEHYFPHAHEDGFDEQHACEDFAERFAVARDEELNTGSQKGFEDFCENFYAHKYGGQHKEIDIKVDEAPVAAPKKEEKNNNWYMILGFLLFLVLIAVVYYFCCRKPA